MKGLLLICALGTVSCAFHARPSVGGDGGDQGTPDAGQPIDAPVVTIDGCQSFSTQLDTCALGATDDVMITGNRIYNTDTHVLADVGGDNEVAVPHARIAKGSDMLDAIVAKRFTLAAGARLHVIGSVAFGVVASDQLLIAGTLDAGGGSFVEAAGARSHGDCGGAAGSNASNHNGGAPGGGGGGFRSTGGTGGQGDSNGVPTAGGNGGALEAMPTGFPKGGCPGGDGGNAGPNTLGQAGRGGGAIDLISAVSIDVSGGITAGGSGGLGGLVTDGGGGGGGSGGMIVLEAPSLGGAGGVAANGGGGGGGGGTTLSGMGGSGQLSTDGASGGTAADRGSPGGPGGAATTLDGATVTVTTNAGGGGGGGGGAGYIRVLGDPTPTFAIVSPPPS
jgi:hypothetical protein